MNRIRVNGTGRIALASVVLLGLAGCGAIGDILGEKDKKPLPGNRLSVLALERQIEPDQQTAGVEVRLPRPWVDADWPQPGGYANHVMHHLALGDQLKQVWRSDIGAPSDDDQRVVAQPVVADGLVFTMDAESTVSAFDTANGRRVWNTDLTPKDATSGAIGGGVAFDQGRLYASTAYGDVFALDARTGKQIWTSKVGLPLRAAPSVEGGRLFVITYDNQLHALEADSGKEIWNFSAIAENAGLLGAASAALEGGIIVAPFSSGELVALRTDNGTVAWSDQLIRTGRLSAVGTINDINGRPVIDRGRVFAVSHSGRMVSIDLRTGERIWERDIAGVQEPWIAGDFIYLVTVDGEVACLFRRDGRVKWTRQLDRFKDPEKRNKVPVVWYGPVLAGDRLIMASNNDEALSLSPYTGEVLGHIKLSGPAATAPVVANNVLYILTEDAKLLALK